MNTYTVRPRCAGLFCVLLCHGRYSVLLVPAPTVGACNTGYCTRYATRVNPPRSTRATRAQRGLCSATRGGCTRRAGVLKVQNTTPGRVPVRDCSKILGNKKPPTANPWGVRSAPVCPRVSLQDQILASFTHLRVQLPVNFRQRSPDFIQAVSAFTKLLSLRLAIPVIWVVGECFNLPHRLFQPIKNALHGRP